MAAEVAASIKAACKGKIQAFEARSTATVNT